MTLHAETFPNEPLSGDNAIAEYIHPAPGQPVLTSFLRNAMRLLFRGLIHPGMPVAGQRVVLRLLTAGMPVTKGVPRSSEVIAERPCEWHRPINSKAKVILYLHGGAYLIGSPATHRGLCAALAKQSRWSLCALDYRLAPEHPFPAARDDAVATFQSLLARGYAPADVAVAGDSAGGHLGLVLCLRLAELSLPLPGSLVCFSPVADFTGERLHSPQAGDPVVNVSWIDQAADLFCPAGMDRRDPSLSPINADLATLPPLMIQVGEDEVLLNDSLRLSSKARDAGVHVQLERYPACWHVFQVNSGLLSVADTAILRVAAFLNHDD